MKRKQDVVFASATGPRMAMRLGASVLTLLLAAAGFSGTVVKLGSVKQIFGPQDLDLEGEFVYAINFSANDPTRSVRGIPFQHDRNPIPGATLVGPQQVTAWQTKPEFGSTFDANQLEEILHDIRWANSGAGERLRASLAVNIGDEYKLQILISGNNAENRRWDIRVNGREAVDEITSLGVSPGASYAVNRATLYTYQFTATTTVAVIEMGNLFGANDGGDRNPIWQALTLERIFIPPTPDDLVLDTTQFFSTQTGAISRLSVIDRKSSATHVFALAPGEGDTDNSKFTLSGTDLLAQPFDFRNEPPGSTYSIRVRVTDAGDPARFLEKTFKLSLAIGHDPAAITLDANSLSGSAAVEALVAHVNVVDEDSFDRHKIELVPGAGDDQNSYFSINGNELRLARVLPAGATRANIRIRATDLTQGMVEAALILPIEAPRVRINEVLASDLGGIVDETRQPQEWVELHNPLAQWVDLTGYYLSDRRGNLTRWRIPSANLPPNGFLIVLTDGRGFAPSGSTNLHASFSVSSSGEWLGLTAPDGTSVVSELVIPELYPQVSYGVGDDGRAGYFPKPTPGASNGTASEFGNNEVLFSVPHGFFTNSFSLELTARVPDSVIRYTTNNTLPTATSGFIYTGPILIAPSTGSNDRGTRIIRALAISPRAAYAAVKTQTYLFVRGANGPTIDGILTQSRLDSRIRNHATYGPLLDDALMALPVLAVNFATGSAPSTTERLASIELFDPERREEGFEITCGVHSTGTTSLSSPKTSMAAKFRSRWGKSKLRYPVFARGSMFPDGAAAEFKELRLRSHSHDTFFWLGTRENPPVPYGSPPVQRSGDAQLTRNPWIDEMQLAMGQPGKHGRQVHLYLNGAYWGIYHIHEHADEDFMASYLGGDSDTYHFTGATVGGSVHSNGESWTRAWSSLKASLGNYREAARWIDLTNLCDYMILSFYAGNDWDWSSQHNWSAAGPNGPDRGGWKFFQQDSDICLQDVAANCTDQDVPDGIFTRLMTQADFRVLFRDRVYRHCFNDGWLTPERAGGLFEARMQEIATAIIAESARWQPSSSIAQLPWDRDQEWTNEWRYLRNTFFPQRTTRLLQQFRARSGWWPADPPQLSHSGGMVAAGYELRFYSPTGTVFITTNGEDPRLPGGSPNPRAIPGTNAPVAILQPMLVKARVRVGSDWSALREVFFTPDSIPPASAANLIISEIQYHPVDQSDNEFIELLNTSSGPVDLSGVSLGEAVEFRFPRPTVLGAGDRIVIAKDLALFQGRYQTNSSPYHRESINVSGLWVGSLSNGGERITVLAPDGTMLFACAYGAAGNWPGRPDGKGSSLELVDPSSAPKTAEEKTAWLSDPANWRPSSEFHGSPGAPGLGPDFRVLINELAAAPLPPDGDSVELKNVTDREINIGGWFLSDSASNYRKYRFPDDARIPAGGFLLLREADFNNPDNPASLVPFLFGAGGEDVYLLEANSSGALLRFADRFEYGAVGDGVVLGRWPDGTGPMVMLERATPGASNAPAIGGYDAWAKVIFPSGVAPALALPSADPDGDGLSNFAEYAFVLSPLRPNPAPLTIELDPAAGTILIAHRKRTGANLIYQVEVSSDLATWTQAETAIELLSQAPRPDGSTQTSYRLNRGAAGSARQFVRLRVAP